jgi:hypothetical protein
VLPTLAIHVEGEAVIVALDGDRDLALLGKGVVEGVEVAITSEA